MELHWTAPSRTTDGLDLADPKLIPTTAEICRDPLLAPVRAQRTAGPDSLCTPVLRTAGHPGSSAAVDLLPPDLTAPSAQATAIAYRIRVLNRSDRFAEPSAHVLIPGGPPLQGVEGFHAVQTREGVVLEWKGEGDGKVEVVRTLSAAARSANQPPPTDASRKGPVQGHHPAATAVEHLESDLAENGRGPAAKGMGGMLDSGAQMGIDYLYQAERVRVVSLGGGTVTVRSEPSPAVEIAMRDTFPPLPPSGLATIPGSGELASGKGGPTIDLSWQPNTEPDLAGYLVYRTDLGPRTPKATPRLLTPKPFQGPAYRDTEVVAGERYEYRVTAVDQLGNESQSSTAQSDFITAPF